MADDNSGSPELPEDAQRKWYQFADALTRQDELLEAILLQLREMAAAQPAEPSPPPSEPSEPVIPPGIEPKLETIAEEQTRTKQLLEGFNFITGQATVQTAGTAVEVISTIKTYLIIISANSTNTGNIYISGRGVNNGTGYVRAPGESVVAQIDNMKKSVWIDADTSGDGISWLALVD